MKGIVAPHHREALGRSSEPFAKGARAIEDRADFRIGITARCDSRGSQQPEQLELTGVPLRRGIQPLQQRQSFRRVGDRLDIGKPVARSDRRLEPVTHGLLGKTSLGEMLGQQLGLPFRHFGKTRFHRLRDLAVNAAFPHLRAAHRAALPPEEHA